MNTHVKSQQTQQATAAQITALANHILHRCGDVDFTGTDVTVTMKEGETLPTGSAAIVMKCAKEHGGTVNIQGATALDDTMWQYFKQNGMGFLVNPFLNTDGEHIQTTLDSAVKLDIQQMVINPVPALTQSTSGWISGLGWYASTIGYDSEKGAIKATYSGSAPVGDCGQRLTHIADHDVFFKIKAGYLDGYSSVRVITLVTGYIRLYDITSADGWQEQSCLLNVGSTVSGVSWGIGYTGTRNTSPAYYYIKAMNLFDLTTMFADSGVEAPTTADAFNAMFPNLGYLPYTLAAQKAIAWDGKLYKYE